MRDTRLLAPAAAVVVVLAAMPAVAAAGWTTAGPDAVGTQDESTTETIPTNATEATTITVSATGRVEGDPDRAVVQLAATVVADDPANATARLAENVTRLRQALLAANLTRNQFRTTDFNVFQRQTGEPPNVSVTYVAQQGFEVTLDDVNRTGEVIDVAVGAGASEVRNVAFALSEESQAALREAALREAMASARGQATAIASAANLTLVGVRSVTTTGQGPVPVARAAALEAGTATADTEIDAGPVTVVATVQVTYAAREGGVAASNETATAGNATATAGNATGDGPYDSSLDRA